MNKQIPAVFENGIFRPLEPLDITISEGQQVRVTVPITSSPEDILGLAAQVYEDLSEEQIDEIEGHALDRRDFFYFPFYG